MLPSRSKTVTVLRSTDSAANHRHLRLVAGCLTPGRQSTPATSSPFVSTEPDPSHPKKKRRNVMRPEPGLSVDCLFLYRERAKHKPHPYHRWVCVCVWGFSRVRSYRARATPVHDPR